MTTQEAKETREVIGTEIRKNTNSKPAFKWNFTAAHLGIFISIVVGAGTLWNQIQNARVASEAYQKVQQEKSDAAIALAVTVAQHNRTFDETVKNVEGLKKSMDEVKNTIRLDHDTIKELARRMNVHKTTELFPEDNSRLAGREAEAN